MLKVPSWRCRGFATPAAWRARLWARAAPTPPEKRLGRSRPSGGRWAYHQPVPAYAAHSAPFRNAGLPVLICSLVLVLALSRYVRRMEGRMQKSVMRRLAGVWVRDPSVVDMHSTGGGDAVRAPRRPTRESLARPSAPPCAVMRRWSMSISLISLTHLSICQVVVEAVEMQSGAVTTVAMPLALPLQAPAAFAGSGGSVIDATTVATVAASTFPQPEKMAAETFVHV